MRGMIMKTGMITDGQMIKCGVCGERWVFICDKPTSLLAMKELALWMHKFSMHEVRHKIDEVNGGEIK
jgi:hypothetical protein